MIPVDPDEGERKSANDYQVCPNCGVPHKLSDASCGFCGAKLPGKVTIAQRINRSIEKAKWRRRLKSRSKQETVSAYAKKGASNILTFAIGSALTIAGGWFFLRAVSTSAFSDFLIGALFLLYGVYTLINIFKKQT